MDHFEDIKQVKLDPIDTDCEIMSERDSNSNDNFIIYSSHVVKEEIIETESILADVIKDQFSSQIQSKDVKKNTSGTDNDEESSGSSTLARSTPKKKRGVKRSLSGGTRSGSKNSRGGKKSPKGCARGRGNVDRETSDRGMQSVPVTPGPGSDSEGSPASAEREAANEPEPHIWMPPPCSTLVVKRTPRGSMRDSGLVDTASAPRRSITLKRVLEDSIHLAAMERVAAAALDEEEAHDHFHQVSQWVSELPNPGTTGGIPRRSSCITPLPVDPANLPSGPTSRSSPSKSGRTATTREHAETTAEGSEFDSDFDDEYNLDEFAECAGMSRDIPDDEELDEHTRNTVSSVERAMDDAIDQMIGVSNEFYWQADFGSFTAVPETFSGPTPGPIKDYDTPYDAFTDIWSEDIIELIARETNRYAKQVIDAQTDAGKLRPKSRLRQWSETDKDEMYVLLAIYMFMSLDPRTSQHEFWKTTGYLEMPKFRELMSYNRFILLNKFIHFVDNSAVASQDLPQSEGTVISSKLRKVAPVVGHLNVKFQTLYNLHADIAIDESLTLFKGRLSWIQAIRTKAARVGIKSYELCESKTGYLYRFEIYTGKNSERGHFVAPSAALARKSTQVVMDLLKGLEHRGHCVTMDNFYNCPSLARYLKSLGFDCLGTLRQCRKNVPEEIMTCKKNVVKGTIISRHAGDVSCITWKDSKVVNMISTYHNDETYAIRRSGKVLIKPVVVRDYNNVMGGVDLKDQKLSMYMLERKRCVKWYMKIFKRLLNVSVHNALILLLGSLKRRNMPQITHRDFRERLANSLVATHRKNIMEVNKVVPVAEVRLRKDICHVPDNVINKLRRNCHICFRKGLRKTVSTKCTTCEEFMCFKKCWTDYHTLQELPGRNVAVRNRKHQ